MQVVLLQKRCSFCPSTCDRNNVEQSPHGLRADVTEPVLSHQQLGQVEGHLPGDGPLHLAASVCVLKGQRVYKDKQKVQLALRLI